MFNDIPSNLHFIEFYEKFSLKSAEAITNENNRSKFLLFLLLKEEEILYIIIIRPPSGGLIEIIFSSKGRMLGKFCPIASSTRDEKGDLSLLRYKGTVHVINIQLEER